MDKVLIWGQFFLPHYLSDKSPEFHRDIIARIFSDKNEYTAAPRGFSKTTIIQVCLAFICAHKMRNFVVLIEKTFTEASEVIKGVRDEFEDNLMIRQVYGNLIRNKKEKEKDAQGDVNINGVRIRGKGFNTTIRGLKHKNFRPDLIVLDDVEEDQHINNEDQRAKYMKNYNKGIQPAVDPKGTIKVFGTILHYDSLLMNLIKYHKGRVYRAFDPDNPVKTLLWAERWSYPLLEKKKNDMKADLNKGVNAFCNPGDAPILMADLTYKDIKDVKVGDEVMGFSFGVGKRNKLVKSTVKKVMTRQADTVLMQISNGDTIRCTPEHRWFTGRFNKEVTKKGTEYYRNPYAPAKVGSTLLKVLDSPELDTEQEYLWHYLAGMIDGEGACKHGAIQISQCIKTNPETYNRIKDVLDKLRLPYKINEPFPTKTSHSFVIGGGRNTKSQIIDTVFKEPHKIAKEKPKVESITHFGSEKVYALETTTGNYVVWGYASSNSQEFLNNPIDDEGRAFRYGWLWNENRTITLREVLKKSSLNGYAAFDVADSTKDSADYTGIVVHLVDSDANHYRVDVRNLRLDSPGLIDQIFEVWEMWQKFGLIEIGIEKKAFKDQIEVWLNQEKNKRRKYPIVSELKPMQRSKTSRIKGNLQGPYRAGKIWTVTDNNGNPIGSTRSLLNQLYDFPAVANDDLADGEAYIFDMVQYPMREEERRRVHRDPVDDPYEEQHHPVVSLDPY